MVLDPVLFQDNFIQIPYMIPTKVSFWNESFQNEFIPVVTMDLERNLDDHVKVVRAHPGAELCTWIGLLYMLEKV